MVRLPSAPTGDFLGDW